MLDIDMQSPNEFTVNLLTERYKKQFFEMYFKIYECLLKYIFFHFFVLSAVFAFLMGNTHTHIHTHDRIKLCEMADRVHKFEDHIKYIIYDMKVLTVCAVNYLDGI